MAISCDVSLLLPSGPGFPSPAPGEVETIVAGTAGAAQTQTAALVPPTATPTFTATVTRTPTQTPTSTPTFIFRLRSATPPKPPTATLEPASGGLACKLLAQDPEDGTKMSPNEHFDAVWEVRNTGSSAWDEDSVDFVYVSGKKMHEKAAYDLSDRVSRGESIDLIVDMIAPKAAGTYTTEWALRRGSNEFCHVNLTIVVK